MWGVVPSFLFVVSVAASQKKPDFGTSKMEKTLFMGRKEISLCGITHHPKGHVRVQYGLVSTNYALIRAKPSSFNLKAMQPRTFL
jgi:hypothetical protein